MFKETRVSHTTLQGVLSELTRKKFVKKHDIGHQNVDYEITEKGRRLLQLLLNLQEILR
jgi:DNA-binding HxlR family transcriptional regulator